MTFAVSICVLGLLICLRETGRDAARDGLGADLSDLLRAAYLRALVFLLCFFATLFVEVFFFCAVLEEAKRVFFVAWRLVVLTVFVVLLCLAVADVFAAWEVLTGWCVVAACAGCISHDNKVRKRISVFRLSDRARLSGVLIVNCSIIRFNIVFTLLSSSGDCWMSF